MSNGNLFCKVFNRLFGRKIRALADQEFQRIIRERDYESRLLQTESNLRLNNEIRMAMESKLLQFERKWLELDAKYYDTRIFQIEENLRSNNEFIEDCKKDKLSEIDYFDFENYFRGPREVVKGWQEGYLKYFEGRKNVLDMGCGRGEFLEVLTEAGVDARGVDLYHKFVEYCQELGLNVIEADAIQYLYTQEVESVGGIFASQVIEHLRVDQLIEFCRLAYQRLEEGAYLILETPNPTCLAVFTHAFYVDLSHNKPVHPLTVKYILERAGYREIEIVYTETSRLSEQMPQLKGQGIDNLEEFNQGIKAINDLLYGSQDYAIIARK